MFLLVGTLLSPGVVSVAADDVFDTDVAFGIQRTGIAPGFDFEALCHVTASYEAVAVRDGASAASSVTTKPGGCGIALYLFGIRVPVPLPFQTPLGRLSLFLPNVRVLTLGLVDVTFDLTARLRGDVSGDGSVLSATPGAVEWTAWGPVTTTVAAHAGTRGSVWTAHESVRLTYVFDLTVVLRAFGITLFTWYASLLTLEGTPSVVVPVSIDLAPNAPTITRALAASPYAVEVLWTQNRDADFARYEVTVAWGGGARQVFFVADPSETSLLVATKPATTYTVVVSAVDAGGQGSSSRAATVTTPKAPDPPGGEVLAASSVPGLLR